MKKLLLILLCLPMIGLGQTPIPDANFEQALINLGYDTGTPNGSVPTANINTIIDLNIAGNGSYNISDLTGIEDFIALDDLRCYSNQLTSLDLTANTDLTFLDCSDNQLTILDVSNNSALSILSCHDNQLTSLDIRNGNNVNMQIHIFNNPNLYCINVDDAVWSTTNQYFWSHIDLQHYFSDNCSGTTSIQENTRNKILLKVTDLLGRETKNINKPLFYIYDDGTVEKRIVIE
jgi:Leucine-rich repeat (LRR) protein